MIKQLGFTSAEYTIIEEFIAKFGIKQLFVLINHWQGTAESAEDFIYSLTERLASN